jgi:hypothetical protein
MPVLYGPQGQEKLLTPAPFVSISTQIDRFEDGRVKKYLFNITLKGRMLAYKGGVLNNTTDPLQGALEVVPPNSRQAKIQQKIGQLNELFRPKSPLNPTERVSLQITPWDASGANSTILCYPRVKSIEIPEGPFTDYFEYTINLEADYLRIGTNTIGMDAEDDVGVEESWSMEPDDSLRKYKLTHQVSAQATTRWVGGTTNRNVRGFEIARAAVLKKLASDLDLSDNAALSSPPSSRLKLNDQPAGLSYFGLGGSLANAFSEQPSSGQDTVRAYDAIRTITVDEAGGKFSVSESWTIVDLAKANADLFGALSGSNYIPALEEFNISIKDSAESTLKTISIDGTITALRTSRTGAFEQPETKYVHAKSKWDLLAANNYKLVRDRVVAVLGSEYLSNKPAQVTIGHNKVAGTITYNVEFNNKYRPPVFVDAKFFEVSFTDNGGGPLFAAIDVLGRVDGANPLGKGPIYQNLMNITKTTRDINMEVVVGTINQLDGRPLKPSREDAFLALAQLNIIPNTAIYPKLFIEKITDGFNYTTGRYNFSVTYAYGK